MKNDKTAIATQTEKIFKVLKLKIAFLIHFQETDTKKIKINKSVAAVPIATPTAGLLANTYLPKSIDRPILSKVPPNNA